MSTTTRDGARTVFVPGDIDAERRVLGILIQSPKHIDLAIDRLRPEHFFDPMHRRIFETLLDLYSKQARISYTQVHRALRRQGAHDLEEVLIEMTRAFTNVVELGPSIDVMLEKWGKRAILQAADRIREMILLDEEEDLETAQAKAQQIIFEATHTTADDEVKSLMEVLNKCYMRLLERREGKKLHGIPVRFPAIDAMTRGFQRKDLIILAARPSMGKTSLALNFCVNVARKKPVLIFSLEMDDEQIGDRIVIGELFRLRDKEGRPAVSSLDYATRLSDEQFEMTQSIFNELFELPIFVIDKRGLTAMDIRAKARKVKAEHPDLSLIVIDYLQLVKPPPQGNRNWSLVVGDIVREIRDLAGELDVPIVLLSQLNRGVEARENKRPIMSDLRDSGNIEEFADVVMFLYREDYYYPEKAQQEGTEGLVEVIVAKQRKGPTGSVQLRFHKEFTRFVEESPRRDAS